MCWRIIIALVIITGIALAIYFGIRSKKNEKFEKDKKSYFNYQFRGQDPS